MAAALDVETGEARELLRTWAQGQRNLWQRNEAEGRRPFGLDADAHAAVLDLAERDDDPPAPAVTTTGHRPPNPDETLTKP